MDDNQDLYFYQFLTPVSKELADMANELEKSIYSSPRTMLTHARTFVEAVLLRVLHAEHLGSDEDPTLKERIDLLDKKSLLPEKVTDALHEVRMNGNAAAHETRSFRYSEALLSWEALYTIVSWYVKKYCPLDVKVPAYRDPVPETGEGYEIDELEARLKNMEKMIRSSLQQQEGLAEELESAADDLPEAPTPTPGLTSVRTIVYKNRSLEVPHFLRDAFLLPQRFRKSEDFLLELGTAQEARLMSELPNNLEDLHTEVEGFSEKDDEHLFEDLKAFIEEETERRSVSLAHPGELFLFYQTDYVIITEALAGIPLTEEEFGLDAGLFKQLHDDQIERVGQLPRELVVLAKYENVEFDTVEKLFRQLKEKQEEASS